MLPGDVVISERGFTCDDYVRMAYVEVTPPPPLSQRVKKVETVPSLLEPRAVCCLYSCQASHRGYKAKVYHLTKCLPISFIGHNDDIGNTTVDKLVSVCCCMVNLCPSVVPQD